MCGGTIRMDTKIEFLFKLERIHETPEKKVFTHQKSVPTSHYQFTNTN